MMHMTFYWGKTVTILFDSWKTDSWLSYALSLLACFFFSVFYQYMEDRRLKFKLLSASKPSQPPPIQTPLLSAKFCGGGKYSPAKLATAFLFGVNSAIGYMLMLVVMSFNADVFVAVVVGLSIGYLVFRGGDEADVTVVVDNPCACA